MTSTVWLICDVMSNSFLAHLEFGFDTDFDSFLGALCAAAACSSFTAGFQGSLSREGNGRACSQPVKRSSPGKESPYGTFPDPEDPFHFVPCTYNLTIPELDAKDPVSDWTGSWNPDPETWEWVERRGINLCGYLDTPLDYTNSSDDRIARLSVVKYRAGASANETNLGQKSERTILFNPGGPGSSGTSDMRNGAGSFLSDELSDGQFDVLGWDPRGVLGSLPSISCYPY